MRGRRQRQATAVASALAAGLLAVLLVAVPRPPTPPAARPAHATPPPTSALPTLRLDLEPTAWHELFAGHDVDESKHYVAATFTDERGATMPARVALRGFSRWHHGPTKPSLRLKPKGSDETVELQRPEDWLAAGNAIPDALAAHLGLLHAHTEPVRVFFGERFAGVYLRSRRPDTRMALAGRRPEGTFFKGDNLGKRLRLDLWATSANWRVLGTEDADGIACLDELLAVLRQPPSPARCERLWQLLDFEVTARTLAVATLVGSLHADRAHNHLLFFSRARGRLEPILWDANAFGMHAEPTAPVDAMRHPLAAAWLCDPRLLHRRDEILYELLRDDEPLARLREHARRVAADLAADPEPGDVTLLGDTWHFVARDGSAVTRACEQVEAWVTRRQHFLHRWLSDARVSVTEDTARGACIVEVHGNVGVHASVRGGPAQLLLPGRSRDAAQTAQNVNGGGQGVPVAHCTPVPLRYELAAPAADLEFHNAITGELVVAGTTPPSPAATRSAHPWTLARPAATEQHLGPGDLELTATLQVPAGTHLVIRPGTTIRLHPGVGIVCHGPLTAIGSATAPIRLLPATPTPWGALALAGSPSARLQHVTLRGGGPLRLGHRTFAGMLTAHDCPELRLQDCQLAEADTAAMALLASTGEIERTRIGNVRGTGIVAEQTRLRACDSRIAFCWRAAVHADAGADVVAERVEVTGCETAATTRHDGSTAWVDCRNDAAAPAPR